MILEIIITLLIIWNITLSYYLFQVSYVKYGSLEDILVKLMAGCSPDEIFREADDEISKICERRGWKK